MLASFRIRDITEIFWIGRYVLFLALFPQQPLLFFKSLFFNRGVLKIAIFECSLVRAQSRVRWSNDFAQAFWEVVQIEDEVCEVILPGAFLGHLVCFPDQHFFACLLISCAHLVDPSSGYDPVFLGALSHRYLAFDTGPRLLAPTRFLEINCEFLSFGRVQSLTTLDDFLADEVSRVLEVHVSENEIMHRGGGPHKRVLLVIVWQMDMHKR